MSQQSFTFSPFIAGFWRLDSWQQTPQQTLALIQHYLSLGVTCMLQIVQFKMRVYGNFLIRNMIYCN